MRVTEKLEHFTNDVMAHAATQRQKILEGVDKTIDKTFQEKETEIYNRAYSMIQAGMKTIEKEKNEIILKAMMDNKVALLKKRTEVMGLVFEEVRDQLRAFTKSDGYTSYLMDLIERDLGVLNTTSAEVILNYTDAALKEQVALKFGVDVRVERKQMDFIGGCRIMDKAHQRYIDDAFETLLMAQKDDFLQDCHIEVY